MRLSNLRCSYCNALLRRDYMTQVPKRDHLKKKWFNVLGKAFELACDLKERPFICLSHFENIRFCRRPVQEIPKPLPFRNYNLGEKMKWIIERQKAIRNNRTNEISDVTPILPLPFLMSHCPNAVPVTSQSVGAIQNDQKHSPTSNLIGPSSINCRPITTPIGLLGGVSNNGEIYQMNPNIFGIPPTSSGLPMLNFRPDSSTANQQIRVPNAVGALQQNQRSIFPPLPIGLQLGVRTNIGENQTAKPSFLNILLNALLVASQIRVPDNVRANPNDQLNFGIDQLLG